VKIGPSVGPRDKGQDTWGQSKKSQRCYI